MTQSVMQAFLVVCFLSATLLRAQTAMETYQQGLVQEQAAGNLSEAIELYERAAKEAGPDRTLAAKALIRAAASYRKLGRPESVALYEQVQRAYPEQREQAMMAQQQLAELRRTTSLRAQAASTDVSATADPMLKTYCNDCHSQSRRVGGLTLDTINTQDVALDTATWEKIVGRLRSGVHAPTRTWPDEATERSVIASIEVALDHAHPLNTPLNTADLVTDAELASRLATFLWNANPDPPLEEAGRRGTLKDPAVLEQQVRRMLRDPRAAHFVRNFFGNWLHLSDLDSALAEPAVFPDFNQTQRADFTRETELFLQYQLGQDQSAEELLTANYTFVNERLAAFYGIPNVSGDSFRRVALGNDTRAGLLGQASILTLTSIPNRTSPTLRGKWIIETLLGVPLPPPPPNIPPLPEGSGSMRKRISEATNRPLCLTCHTIFDPLGFAFENFDGVGRWRSVDGGEPVDSSGSFVDGTRFNGPAEFRAALLKYRSAYLTNVTRQLLANGLGRRSTVGGRVYPYEMPAVRAIVREAAAGNYRWSALVAGVVKSTAFRMKNIVP